VCGNPGSGWSGWLRGDFRKIQFGGAFSRSLLARRSRSSGQIFVTETGSTLKTAAQFAEALGTTLIATLGVNLFELRGKFGGAAVVAGAEDEIEKFFEGRSVARSTAEDGFEQTNGFLGKPVTGEEINIRERLGDKPLRIFVERSFRRRRGGFGGNLRRRLFKMLG
jgi:hypothetical protein